jgi:hypothetical protein
LKLWLNTVNDNIDDKLIEHVEQVKEYTQQVSLVMVVMVVVGGGMVGWLWPQAGPHLNCIYILKTADSRIFQEITVIFDK